MILLDGDRLGELNSKAVGVGPYNLTTGFIMLFPGKSQNDLVTGRRRRLTADEDPLGADVMDEFTMGFFVDYIIHRDHTLPSVIRPSTGHGFMTSEFHDVFSSPIENTG